MEKDTLELGQAMLWMNRLIEQCQALEKVGDELVGYGINTLFLPMCERTIQIFSGLDVLANAIGTEVAERETNFGMIEKSFVYSNYKFVEVCERHDK